MIRARKSRSLYSHSLVVITISLFTLMPLCGTISSRLIWSSSSPGKDFFLSGLDRFSRPPLTCTSWPHLEFDCGWSSNRVNPPTLSIVSSSSPCRSRRDHTMRLELVEEMFCVDFPCIVGPRCVPRTRTAMRGRKEGKHAAITPMQGSAADQMAALT